MEAPVLEFRSVSKRFNGVHAVDGVGFAVRPSEVFTLLGPSGCGKTTTLRLAAGLEEPEAGEILLNGAPVAAPARRIFVPPDKRRMGMVFQSYAIWPHLTVFENVAFPLRARGESAGVIETRVREALEMVDLAGLGSRNATELSGGQQQRVALARALVYAPAMLLLDEPLSNLDAKLREQMRLQLRSLQRKLRLAILYVTHDQAEAMSLSDRIAVMQRGCIEQAGAPAELYDMPASSFVGEFLGRTVAFEGVVRKNHAGQWVELDGNARLPLPAGGVFGAGDTVRVVARPEDIEILPSGELAEYQIGATINEICYLGDHFEYQVETGGGSFLLSANKRQRLAPGAKIRLAFAPNGFKITPR